MSYHKSNGDLPLATPTTVDNGFRGFDLHGTN